MPYLGFQIRDFALFTFVPEQKLCARWMHSRLRFLVRWCLVRHWWRRRARGSRQRRDLVVIVFLCLRWWWRHSGRVAHNSGLKLCFERRWRYWISRSLLLVHGGLLLSHSDQWASWWVARSVLVKVWLRQRLRSTPMASGPREPRQKSTPYGFGWHPRPKTTLFYLTPICLGSGTGTEYQKQPGPKALTALVR